VIWACRAAAASAILTTKENVAWSWGGRLEQLKLKIESQRTI
jgi:hypothetical protein